MLVFCGHLLKNNKSFWLMDNQLTLFLNKSDSFKKIEDNEKTRLPSSPLQNKLNHEEIIISERELEIMKYILSGLSIKEMGLKVFLSLFGVKYRMSSIYSKFNCKNRLELIKQASTVGLQFKTEKGEKYNFFLEIKTRKNDNE